MSVMNESMMYSSIEVVVSIALVYSIRLVKWYAMSNLLHLGKAGGKK